ncbi:MAG: DNA primase [Lachnospiraceae bacterium]|nr:DNA primase [Lachnospiraceae bacterium]
MYYSDELIEDVRRRNDIVDVIGSYVSLKRAGSGYKGLCPFHNEKTPSFSVSPNRQTFKCFGCGKGGNVFTFVMEYDNMTFIEALQLLAERGGIELPKTEMTSAEKGAAAKKHIMLEIYKKAATMYFRKLRSEEGKHGYGYLKGRGLSDDTIVKFGLGYCPPSDSGLYRMLKDEGISEEMLKESALFNYSEAKGVTDRFWNRVMFPIMDVNSKVIAFGGRVMGDALPKYINSNETIIYDKGRNLYALYLAKRTRQNFFLLCEGYMDAISLYQAGFDNAVASLGTALTPNQARLIARYTKNVIITYDSDGAGRHAALRAIPILKKAGIVAKVLNMQPYKDPDEFIKALGREEYEKRIKDATPGIFFEADCIKEEYDTENPEELTKFHNRIASKMLEFEEELERTNYMKAVSKRYALDYEEFRKLVNNIALGVTKKEESREDTTVERVPKKEQNVDAAAFEREKLLLTWACEEKAYCDLLTSYLTPESFQEGVPRQVAELVFKKLEDGSEKLLPATLISSFSELSEQSLASDLFQSGIWENMSGDKTKQDKAFSEALSGCIKADRQRKLEEAIKKNDGAAMQKLLTVNKDKSKLESEILKKLNGLNA